LPIVGWIYAHVGFVFAFIIGVPLARYFIKQRQNDNKKASIEKEYLVGILENKKASFLGYEKTLQVISAPWPFSCPFRLSATGSTS